MTQTLLSTDAHLLRASEKTNLAVSFSVPAHTKRLDIRFSYAPKTLNGEAARPLIEACLQRDAGEFAAQYPDWTHFLPLKNLVTVSLDDPNGFRGCAHRQDDVQAHFLTEDAASPGFLPGKLPAGVWRVMLNIHALVTKSCDCTLKVDAEVDEHGR